MFTVKDSEQNFLCAVSDAWRTPAAPDIPSFVEQGLPGDETDAWFTVLGPKGMNAAGVKRAHDARVAAFTDPASQETRPKPGNTLNISSSDQAVAKCGRELAQYTALVEQARVKPQ